jgi:hypothetical protein
MVFSVIFSYTHTQCALMKSNLSFPLHSSQSLVIIILLSDRLFMFQYERKHVLRPKISMERAEQGPLHSLRQEGPHAD